jgi:hypothetical protein
VSPFEQRGFPSFSISALDHLECGDRLEEEVAGRARNALDLLGFRAASKRREEDVVVNGADIDDAHFPRHSLSAELIASSQCLLGRIR